ncbi:hypothetical protein C8J56DRAFT_937537 [Mycena floridula]|nr:hypothetical protein C8J56DRAFT_937537 [Mycena floridula]
MILSTSPRWKAVYIFTTLKSLESFSSLRGSLPSMTTLRLWLRDSQFPETTLSLFEFAPKLTKLFGKPYVLRKLDLPFSQITTCGQGGSSTCVASVDLLSRMPNVQLLTTTCLSSTSTAAVDLSRGIDANNVPGTITLPSLRHAVLLRNPVERQAHSTNQCPLVLRLIVPALKELKITIHGSIDELLALLHRSRCRLDILFLEGHDVPDDARIALLKDIPTLTSFTLKCSEAFSTKFIEAFSQSPLVASSLRFLRLKNLRRFDSVQVEQLKASRPMLFVSGIEALVSQVNTRDLEPRGAVSLKQVCTSLLELSL